MPKGRPTSLDLQQTHESRFQTHYVSAGWNYRVSFVAASYLSLGGKAAVAGMTMHRTGSSPHMPGKLDVWMSQSCICADGRKVAPDFCMSAGLGFASWLGGSLFPLASRDCECRGLALHLSKNKRRTVGKRCMTRAFYQRTTDSAHQPKHFKIVVVTGF